MDHSPGKLLSQSPSLTFSSFPSDLIDDEERSCDSPGISKFEPSLEPIIQQLIKEEDIPDNPLFVITDICILQTVKRSMARLVLDDGDKSIQALIHPSLEQRLGLGVDQLDDDQEILGRYVVLREWSVHIRPEQKLKKDVVFLFVLDMDFPERPKMWLPWLPNPHEAEVDCDENVEGIRDDFGADEEAYGEDEEDQMTIRDDDKESTELGEHLEDEPFNNEGFPELEELKARRNVTAVHEVSFSSYSQLDESIAHELAPLLDPPPPQSSAQQIPPSPSPSSQLPPSSPLETTATVPRGPRFVPSPFQTPRRNRTTVAVNANASSRQQQFQRPPPFLSSPSQPRTSPATAAMASTTPLLARSTTSLWSSPSRARFTFERRSPQTRRYKPPTALHERDNLEEEEEEEEEEEDGVVEGKEKEWERGEGGEGARRPLERRLFPGRAATGKRG